MDSTATEGKQRGQDLSSNAAVRNNREQSQAAASNLGQHSRVCSIDPLPIGTRVTVTSKDGTKIKGTIRWGGTIPSREADPRQKILIVGIETVSVYIL